MKNYWKNWSNESTVEFYSTRRHSPTELYDSEKYFLPELLRRGMKVLDIGCGAGGFYNIIKSYLPNFSYTGIDISEEMIKEAKRLYPNALFEVTNGANLNYPDKNFDLVICFGVLHMSLNWRLILSEGWRVSNNHFLFDLRLVQDAPTIENIKVSYQNIAYGKEKQRDAIVPYVILKSNEVMKVIKNLNPNPRAIKAYGYFHPISPTAVSPYQEVCMTTFCLSKRNGYSFDWNVPLSVER